ncbi:MAG: PBP1A family penicillin-binding protein [Candidatus Moranbacteria bacterium]|nr:PBP1A family penicillin-binding protein [Candidatus Moranbacteria bacterium]
MGNAQTIMKRIWRITLRFALETTYVVSLFAFGAVLAFAGIYVFGTQDAKTLPTIPLEQTSILYDRTGTHVLYQLHGEENRKVMPHDQISDAMRKATIAAEDSNFYAHHGVDFTSIVRALIADIEAGKIEQGGSTITQQLARNAFFGRERTVKRKILETVMAIKIENTFSKDEILDMYLNRVPYGANAYGVGTAAEVYFGKEAKDLTLDEAALLASLTKAPSLYSPYVAKRSHTINARDRILARMYALGLITDVQFKQSITIDTGAKIVPLTHAIVAPHFVFYVIEQLEKEYGRLALETGGWKIYTTLDWEMQKQAEWAVREGAKKNMSRDATNAALTAVDPRTGEILAMVGSKDFYDASIDGEVNVTTRLRQPGSSFKPIAYATAFSKGFQPETILTDKRINFGPDGSGKDYIPDNYDGRFHGVLSMRQTLSQSLNIPAVQTLYLAGVQQTIDMAHKLGITTLNETNRYGLALVLGGGEVKLLDMTAAFGVFAREGMRAPVHGVVNIIDQGGKHIDDDAAEKPVSVLDPEVARKINSILSDNAARAPIFGSHSPLILPDRPVAAKTGTTQDFRDAWTIGYTPSLAVGVWAGNNDNHAMAAGSDGVFVAAPIWNDFMKIALKDKPVENFSAYTPVTSDKPLLTGNRDGEGGEVKYYDIKSGKELSEKKAKKKKSSKVRVSIKNPAHSILYYVNKNDPLGQTPPDFTDPMFSRWEDASEVSYGGDEGSATASVAVSDAIDEIFISASEYYGE